MQETLIGKCVKLKNPSEPHFSENFRGLVFDYGEDASLVRIMWLNCGLSVHWTVDKVEVTDFPKDINWERVADKLRNWFAYYYM